MGEGEGKGKGEGQEEHSNLPRVPRGCCQAVACGATVVKSKGNLQWRKKGRRRHPPPGREAASGIRGHSMGVTQGRDPSSVYPSSLPRVLPVGPSQKPAGLGPTREPSSPAWKAPGSDRTQHARPREARRGRCDTGSELTSRPFAGSGASLAAHTLRRLTPLPEPAKRGSPARRRPHLPARSPDACPARDPAPAARPVLAESCREPPPRRSEREGRREGGGPPAKQPRCPTSSGKPRRAGAGRPAQPRTGGREGSSADSAGAGRRPREAKRRG